MAVLATYLAATDSSYIAALLGLIATCSDYLAAFVIDSIAIGPTNQPVALAALFIDMNYNYCTFSVVCDHSVDAGTQFIGCHSKVLLKQVMPLAYS